MGDRQDEFQLEVMDADDRVCARETLRCASEEAAIQAALARLETSHAVELRRGGRLIGRYGAATPAKWPNA